MKALIKKAREHWRRLKGSEPGRRYQDHYHHRRLQQGSSGRSILHMLFGIFGGFLIVVGGIVAVPGPGPGWLIILLGLGLVAGESLYFARLIDRVEVRLRRVARRIARAWTTSHALIKVLIALMILVCVAASGYGMYYLIFGS